jgi:flagellar basal-body rod modification protein FlgD
MTVPSVGQTPSSPASNAPASGAGANGGSSSGSSSDLPGLSDNFNTFLTLLTTQLQHQDPLSPMDSTQFTNQLVEFSSVEQAIKENTNLATLISLQQGNQAAAAVSYIGKTVEVSGKSLPLSGGQGQFSYTLQAPAQSTTITIADASGNTVRSMTGETDTARHVVQWDGKDDNGNTLPDGVYTVTVSATDASNQPVTSTTTFFGTVTQVANSPSTSGSGSSGSGQVMLTVSGASVPLSNVISVSNSSASSASDFVNSIVSGVADGIRNGR